MNVVESFSKISELYFTFVFLYFKNIKMVNLIVIFDEFALALGSISEGVYLMRRFG